MQGLRINQEEKTVQLPSETTFKILFYDNDYQGNIQTRLSETGRKSLRTAYDGITFKAYGQIDKITYCETCGEKE